MAGKKAEAPIKEEVQPEIMYEEELISVKEPGRLRYYKLLKAPYIEFHGFKVYLSSTDMHNIASGKVTPNQFLAGIPIEEQYKA